MDHLRTLELFVLVARSGSFSAAADRLELPRSTVSAAIKSLETRLGTRLIQRTTRRMRLTADGEAYLAWCERVLQEFERVEQGFRSRGRTPGGRVRADVPGRVAAHVLAPALPDFADAYPEIVVDLCAGDRKVDLVEEGVDCALRVGAVRDEGVVARPLGRLRQGSYAAPSYIARFGVPLHPGELHRHRCVDYRLPDNGRVDPWEYVDHGGTVHRVDVPSRVSANTADAYLACALAGLGLIQIPEYDAEPYVRSGALQPVLTEWRPAPMPVAILLPHRRYVPQRVRVFVDWLQALCMRCLRPVE